jgi:hypothetical protein
LSRRNRSAPVVIPHAEMTQPSILERRNQGSVLIDDV